MRIVLSHLQFGHFAGTETYMLTVAQQLQRLGHESTIYSPKLGPMAEFARSEGVHVVEDTGKLPGSCDAVISQDAATTHELAGRYTDAVGVYVMHSVHHPMQSPPQLEGSCQALVVMNDRLLERAGHLAWHPEIVRLRQPIDVRRFSVAGVVTRSRSRPRVLALGNQRGSPYDRLIDEACQRAGVELVRVGGVARSTPHPEHAIASADMVISQGRGVLEAMAGGRAAYVLGPPGGGDGWVTEQTYSDFESDGFGGTATEATIDVDRLASDLSEWDDSMGEPGRALVWTHHDGDSHAGQLIELIRRLGATGGTPPRQSEELARLVRLEWYSYERAEAALGECRRLGAEADTLRGLLSAAEDRVQEITSTRRYRIATRIAQPFDRLRSRR